MLHPEPIPITDPNGLTIAAAITKRITVRIGKPIRSTVTERGDISITNTDANASAITDHQQTKVLIS